jgi:hypothetical protein
LNRIAQTTARSTTSCCHTAPPRASRNLPPQTFRGAGALEGVLAALVEEDATSSRPTADASTANTPRVTRPRDAHRLAAGDSRAPRRRNRRALCASAALRRPRHQSATQLVSMLVGPTPAIAACIRVGRWANRPPSGTGPAATFVCRHRADAIDLQCRKPGWIRLHQWQLASVASPSGTTQDDRCSPDDRASSPRSARMTSEWRKE